MTSGFRCDNCKEFTQSRAWIFNCVECNKEICDSCMHGWATCKECAVGKTDAELKARFDSREETFDNIGLTDFLIRASST